MRDFQDLMVAKNLLLALERMLEAAGYCQLLGLAGYCQLLGLADNQG